MTRTMHMVGIGTVLGLGLSTLAMTTAGSPAMAADASVSINSPGSPTAGQVAVTGNVGVGPGETTSVLYVVDATASTSTPSTSDCSGNGTSGPEDDLNGDGSVGDVLDCELSGILALNHSLAGTQGVQAGLVAFANQAAVANLDPTGSAAFVPTDFTGGDAQPRVDTVARSVVRSKIGLYEDKPLGGSGAGTAFNSAVQVALSTLAAAPAGPKWVMFLSDGQSPIDDSLLAQLAGSGVHLRTFGVGADASCIKSGSLFKMASATGESCTVVSSPASLAAGLTGSTPDSVFGVTVTIKGVSVAAQLGTIGGWSAAFNLGAGTYTATAKAVLASGSTSTVSRTFTVVAAPTGGPPPGTVNPGTGALRATVVKVERPKPQRDALPRRVIGRVGVEKSGLKVSRKLAGSRVELQAREANGSAWTTVGHAKVSRAGQFAVRWKPRTTLTQLRVVLDPSKRYAGSAAAVPTPKISACTVDRHRNGWTVSCHTVAKKGSAVRLLRSDHVVDRSRVRNGSFTLHGTGPVGALTIDVAVGHGRHVRLDL